MEVDEIIEEICDTRCKYVETWTGEGDLSDSDICAECPLNRLTDYIAQVKGNENRVD